MEKNNPQNTVSRRRVVPIKINSIFIDFSGYQMQQVGGNNHNSLPSRLPIKLKYFASSFKLQCNVNWLMIF